MVPFLGINFQFKQSLACLELRLCIPRPIRLQAFLKAWSSENTPSLYCPQYSTLTQVLVCSLLIPLSYTNMQAGEYNSSRFYHFCVRQFMPFSLFQSHSLSSFSWHYILPRGCECIKRNSKGASMRLQKRKMHELMYTEIANLGLLDTPGLSKKLL